MLGRDRNRSRAEKEERKELDRLVRYQDIDAISRVLSGSEVKGATASKLLEALISFDSPEAWDAIARLISDSQAAAVEICIQRLGELQSSGAIRVLGDALGNSNVFIRSAVVRTLSSIESSAVIAHLLRATRDPESSISRMASRVIMRRIERRPMLLAEIRPMTAEGVLGLLDDRWAMELLAPEFPDSIRKMAARRLGEIGGEESTQVLASMLQSVKGELLDACWAALESCPSVSDFVLLPLLVDPRPEIKSRAIRVYARFADSNAADLLAGLAADAAPKVRREALSGLTQLTSTGSIPHLVTALEDPVEENRELAIDLLTQLEDSSPELVQIVQACSGELRRKALITLANRGVVLDELMGSYIEFVYQGASCTDLSQRDYLDSLAAVAKTLGTSLRPEAMIAICALANSVIRRLRRAAVEGLMKYEPADRSDALATLVDTHDPDVLKNVAFGLLEASDERAVIPLIRTALECRGRPMIKAKEALLHRNEAEDVDFLVSGLGEKWASVKRWSAEKLKELRDPKAIAALLEASNDEDVEVQLAVFEAMGPFASEREDVRTRMLECIEYGDISVRQAACEALGEARCREAVPALIKALNNFFLRPRATDALKRIGDRKGYLAMKRIERREKLFPKKGNMATAKK